MPILDFLTKYSTILTILLGTIGAAIWLAKNWKKETDDHADNTIKLFRAEVDALKLRLDTASTQISELTTQILGLNKQITELTSENNTLKSLITVSLNEYFKHNKESIETITQSLGKEVRS